jgi:hypothetical protein
VRWLADECVAAPLVARLRELGHDVTTFRKECRFGPDHWHHSTNLEVYNLGMNNKTATRDNRRRTTTVPVTTMEEILVLSETEREELLTSLKAAEARAKALRPPTMIRRASRIASSVSIEVASSNNV